MLKAVLTAIVLGYCVSRADLNAVAHDIATASPSSLVLALTSFLLVPALGGLRWWLVLRAIGQRARIGTLTCLFSVAMAVGQVLPSLAGDGFRAWLAVRGGYPPRPTLHSIFLERALMLLGLLAVGVGTQPLLTERLGPAAPCWGAALLFVGGLSGLAILIMAERISPWIGNHRFSRALAGLSDDARRAVLSRWSLPISFIVLLSNLNFIAAMTLLGQALHVQASLMDFLAFVPLVTVATMLPISFGGWGVREGAMVALLHTVGVSPSNALALSLTAGVFGSAAALPGLLVWWLRRPPEPIGHAVTLVAGA